MYEGATCSSINQEANMEEQIYLLKGMASSYLMLAMALKRDGYEYKHYLKLEAECYNQALEIEENLEEINSYMLVA